MTVVDAFLEMAPSFVLAGIAYIQCFVWFLAIKRLLEDTADVEDVLLLIPGAVFVGITWKAARNIPNALKRKP